MKMKNNSDFGINKINEINKSKKLRNCIIPVWGEMRDGVVRSDVQ